MGLVTFKDSRGELAGCLRQDRILDFTAASIIPLGELVNPVQ